MGFFNKRGGKKSGIPELPELPNFSENIKTSSSDEFESEDPAKYKLLSLPSYPNSSLGERINQSAIKDAVTYGEPEIEQKKMRTISINQAMLQQKQPRIQKQSENLNDGQTSDPRIFSRTNRKAIEISDYESPTFSTQLQPRIQSENLTKIRQTGPLFIQLDKFESSIAALDEIKAQVSEIESLLRSIQEIKNKEEEKLAYWQKQIESIKAHLDKIDIALFSNI